MKNRLILAAYGLAAIALLTAYASYLDKPDDGAWGRVKDYIAQSDYPEAPINFQPGWYMNYATDHGRFRGYNLSGCDGCSLYWLVSSDASMPNGYKSADSTQIGPLTVNLLAAANVNVKSKEGSLTSTNPKVSIETDGKIQECTFNGKLGKECYSADWQRIERRVMTSGGQNKKCIFAHPREGSKLRLDYQNVRLGKTLSFTSAIEDGFVTGDMSPVTIDVNIGGKPAGQITQKDIKGWTTATVDTKAHEGENSDIEFVIYADNDQKRHFCYSATAD